LGDVDEADHSSFLLYIEAFDQALLDLKEFEFWNVLVINTFHTWQVFNNEVQIFILLYHLG
jgi:hypothetical protein